MLFLINLINLEINHWSCWARFSLVGKDFSAFAAENVSKEDSTAFYGQSACEGN